MTETRTPTVERRLAALADALELFVMPAALFRPDGSYVTVNRMAASAGGYATGDLAGRHFGDLMPGPVKAGARAHFTRCVADVAPAEFETLFLRESGDEAPVRIRLLPLAEAGEVVGVLAVAYETKEDALMLEHLKASPSLTRRQHEILALLAAAHSTADIAARLGLATETVRNHVRALLKELNAHSRLEAVVTAERLGLLPPTPFPTK